MSRRRLHNPLVMACAVALALTSPGGVLAVDPVPEGAVVTDGGRVLPPMPEELQQPSTHAQMLADQGDANMDFAPGGAPSVLLEDGSPKMAGDSAEPVGTIVEPLSAAALPNGLRKEVFGFLPYWMLTDSALASMNYSLVSTIAYFSVGVTADGYLIQGSSTGWTGWNSSRMTQVIDRAHANGVKVVLTITMMGWDSASTNNMVTLLSTPTYRTRLANAIASAVRTRGVDGVNLDFEPVPTTQRANYVSFVKQVKSALVSGGAGSYLTVCVMAGSATWATGYDVAGLTSSGAADALFVMGYDYHWSGSSRAGGVAPIQSPYTIDVDGTMRDFLAETSGSKLIWGVPYYGRKWRTTSDVLNSTTRSGGSVAYNYTGHLAEANQYGRRWDDVGKVPWYRYYDNSVGTWMQGYYDDAVSLGVKYDLINSRGLAGTGMWTLLMDQGRDELWRLLADKFVNDTAPPVGGITLLPPQVDEQSVTVRWRAVDHASGVDRYNVQVKRDGGSWAAWLSNTRATSATFSGDSGATYTFRVQAIDWKGNAQPWIEVPAQPASLASAAFAQVSTDALNVRSAAGTGYAIVATLPRNATMYVLEGPVAANGYNWYRVQYGFTEWPSADFAQIGWVASGAGGEAYLAPAAAPTRVTLKPFVTWSSRTPAFSPNADGVQDTASTTFGLTGAAASVRVDVVNSANSVVRSLALGARGAGTHTATWDGKLTSGAVAPDGSYLMRIVATDGAGSTHVGPSSAADPGVMSTHGVALDLVRPTVAGTPGNGASMVPASGTMLQVTFSEAMGSVPGTSVQLRDGGTALPVATFYDVVARRLTVDPTGALPTGKTISVVVAPSLRDAAGNPVVVPSWSFRTAPGTAYDPPRYMSVQAGSHAGFFVDENGGLSSPKSFTLRSSSATAVGQRARLPNLPGRWVHVAAGIWQGRWMREGAARFVAGEVERNALPSPSWMRVWAGTHVGYKYDVRGVVTATRSYYLRTASSAQVTARAIINGRPHMLVAAGVWAGYWLPETSRSYVQGTADRADFPASPRIGFAGGTHTGYQYDSWGRVTAWRRYTLPRASAAQAAGWAVINGVPHTLIATGVWAGFWVPESTAASIAY